MIARRGLGRAGLSVSALTLGTAGLARGDRDEARAALALALDSGIDAIELDAADDDAIALLGEALRGRREVHVFARLPSLVRFDLPSPHVPADLAYPGGHLRSSVEALLSLLGIERIAIAQLHAWCPEWLGEGDWCETLEALRAEGKIGAIGISLFDHDVDAGIDAVAQGAVDAVQLLYNVFDPGAAAVLLPEARRNGTGVIARAPLYHGALASGWRGGAGDYFYPEHRDETTQRVARLAQAFGEPVEELALRFALSHPAIGTVAVGMRTRAQVAANLAVLERGPLAEGQLAMLAAHKWLC